MAETDVQPDQTPDRDPEAPYGRRKDGTPKRKTGPDKGVRPKGRGKGSKNKATLEREAKVRLDAERARLEAEAAAAGDVIKAAQAQSKKLMKEIAFDFAELFGQLAALYQPVPPLVRGADGRWTCPNPNYDEERFRYYSSMAKETSIGAAAYQSPRFSAMMVGATVVNRIEVTGGMPDDFASTPAPALPPGTVVTADDVSTEKVEVIPPPLKIAAG